MGAALRGAAAAASAPLAHARSARPQGAADQFGDFIQHSMHVEAYHLYIGYLQSAFIVGYASASVAFGHLVRAPRKMHIPMGSPALHRRWRGERRASHSARRGAGALVPAVQGTGPRGRVCVCFRVVVWVCA